MSRLAPALQSFESSIDEIAHEIPGDALAVSLFDYETGLAWARHGDRWFHSASTIKVAVLFALFGAVDAGRFTLDSRLHVRNRFLSAMDGRPFRVAAARDADREVHAAIGKTMKLRELARHMIVTSSNLATNLLVDLVGVEQAQQMLEHEGITGIELARGVEDDKAFEAAFNNRVTANGLVRLFRTIYERRGPLAAASSQMLDILLQQEFRAGIPAGLPPEVRPQARVANKTGEISIAAHDAGLVFLSDQQPYAVAILTEPAPEMGDRMERVARVSTIVFDWIVASRNLAREAGA